MRGMAGSESEERKKSEETKEGAGAEVEEGGGCGGRERQGAEEAALVVEDAEGGFAGEGGVEFAFLGIVGERGEGDFAVEAEGGEALAGEVVSGDARGVAAAEGEEEVARSVVGESRGWGGERGEGERADELAEAVELDDGGRGGVRRENMAVARTEGEVAAAGRGERRDGELAFHGAGGAVDDAEAITGREAEKEVIGEGIVGEAEEGFAGGEEAGDFSCGGGFAAEIMHGRGRR